MLACNAVAEPIRSFSSASSLISEGKDCSLRRPKQLCSTSCRTSAVFPVPGEPETRTPGLEPFTTDSISWSSHWRPVNRGSVSRRGTSKNSGFRVSCAAWCWIKRTEKWKICVICGGHTSSEVGSLGHVMNKASESHLLNLVPKMLKPGCHF